MRKKLLRQKIKRLITKYSRKKQNHNTVFYPFSLGRISDFAEEFAKLNDVVCYTTLWRNGLPEIIIESVGDFDLTTAKYPDGYNFDFGNGDTNKDHSSDGLYYCFNPIIVNPETGQWTRANEGI